MDATTFNIGICEMSAELFVRSIEKGYDSKDFIEKLMNSETAEHLYNKMDTQMWLGVNYIMETLENELEIKKGKTYPEDLMSWIGYLFACWNFTYAQMFVFNGDSGEFELAEQWENLKIKTRNDVSLYKR